MKLLIDNLTENPSSRTGSPYLIPQYPIPLYTIGSFQFSRYAFTTLMN